MYKYRSASFCLRRRLLYTHTHTRTRTHAHGWFVAVVGVAHTHIRFIAPVALLPTAYIRLFFSSSSIAVVSLAYNIVQGRERQRGRERENKGGETERDREREGWRGQRVGWYASWLDNVHEVDLSRPWHSPRNNNNNNNIIIIRRSVRIRWTWKGPQNYNNKIQGGLGGRSEGGWELCDQCEQSLIKWEGGWAGGERIINKWRGRSNHIC